MTSPLSTSLLLGIVSITVQAAVPELSKSRSLADGASKAIHFIENKGQILRTDGNMAPFVRFVLERGDARIFLLQNGIAWQFNRVHCPDGYLELMDDRSGMAGQLEELEQICQGIRLETYRMDMTLVGADPHALVTAEGRSEDYTNYYNHNVLDVHHYRKVTYHDVYPGIDWVVYSTEKGMKYDFVVHSGADPSVIRMEYAHQEELYTDPEGRLVQGNRLGRITEEAPVSFQNTRMISTRFVLENPLIRLDMAEYDHHQPLTIDPALVWATYYGSDSADVGSSCTTDGNGNVYLAGTTRGFNAIAEGGYQNTFGGGEMDAFMVKFDANGIRQWGTYYGGDEFNADLGYACTTDLNGNVFLAGSTNSTDGIASGGHQNNIGGLIDAFLVKFDPNGERQWATYYGGSAVDHGFACATDAAGNVFVAGLAQSPEGIATQGAHSTGNDLLTGGDAFVVKFNGAGQRQWGTYYGGSVGDKAYACAVDGAGNVYFAGVTGSTSDIAYGGYQSTIGSEGFFDAFVAKFNGAGVLQWGTYYGGPFNEISRACATDGIGNVYLAGITSSTSGIASPGSHQPTYGGGETDAFLVKFDPNGTRQWASYYGGPGTEGTIFNYDATGCVVDLYGSVRIAGITTSSSGIAFLGHQSTFGGGTFDCFLAGFTSDGVRQWGTYFGGSGTDKTGACAVDPDGYLFLAGYTESESAIALDGHQATLGGVRDAFLAKFEGGTVGMAGPEPQVVSLGPNPTTGNVSLVRGEGSEEGQLALYNSLGELVMRTTIQRGQLRLTLDLTHNEPGVYLLGIESAKGGRSYERIVKE